MTAEKDRCHYILQFLKSLRVDIELPDGVRVMNPYLQKQTWQSVQAFYQKFYSDDGHRHMMVGINPGRLGAGETGIPFTDNKHLVSHCGISWHSKPTHEPSSVFMYDMIDAFGGVDAFYHHFYVTSVSPLGFIQDRAGKEINFNYYDSRELQDAIEPLAAKWLSKQVKFGIRRDVCFVLGTGKNMRFMELLNKRTQTFDRLIALEHPRYIMQYKLKDKALYIQKFVDALRLAMKS